MSRNVWNRSSLSIFFFIIRNGSMSSKGILSTNMKSPLPNVIRHSGGWPIQWHPPLIRHNTYFDRVTELDLITEFMFYLITRGFLRAFAGAACQQRTLTRQDTWSCPTLGLGCVLMLRPISPELVFNVSGLLSFEHTSVLLFYSNHISYFLLVFRNLCTLANNFIGSSLD